VSQEVRAKQKRVGTFHEIEEGKNTPAVSEEKDARPSWTELMETSRGEKEKEYERVVPAKKRKYFHE